MLAHTRIRDHSDCFSFKMKCVLANLGPQNCLNICITKKHKINNTFQNDSLELIILDFLRYLP